MQLCIEKSGVAKLKTQNSELKNSSNFLMLFSRKPHHYLCHKKTFKTETPWK